MLKFWSSKYEEAVKKMKSENTVGPNNIPGEIWIFYGSEPLEQTV